MGGARYKGAGWLARQATNTLSPLVAWLYHATPHAYTKRSFKVLSVLPSDLHLWTWVGKVDCTSSRELRICMDLQARGTTNPWPLTASRKQHIHSANIHFKQTELRNDYSFTVSRISSLWLRSTHSSNPPAPSLISPLAKPIYMRPAASQLNNVNRTTDPNFQTIYYGCISLHSPHPLSLAAGKP